MFKKIDITHDLTFNTGYKLQYRFGKEVAGEFLGISYFSVDRSMEARLLKFLPQTIQHQFVVSLMVINTPEIPAHTDNQILVTVNFYVQTADAVTRFHDFKPGMEPAIEKLENQSDGALYSPECLDTIGEFQASAGEVWILDVKRPHSVSCSTTEPRIAYCLQSNYHTYEDLVKYLK
jgi:hypothetical protein